jgi:hypothetical protein
VVRELFVTNLLLPRVDAEAACCAKWREMMTRLGTALSAAALAFAFAASTALAADFHGNQGQGQNQNQFQGQGEPGDNGGHGGPGGPRGAMGGERGAFGQSFRGRDFHGFTPAEHAAWTGGHWNHGWHRGRFGWWWFVGGFYYLYPDEIYPYPDYVSDDVEASDLPAPAYAPGYWYFCSANNTYYPYTPSCPVPWTLVPAQPPDMGAR